MKLRIASAAALSAALLTPSAAPALSLPDNSDCLTWTDPADDSAALNTTQTAAVTGDPALDIVGVRIESDPSHLVMVVKVAELSETGEPLAGIGDRFVVRYAVAGKVVLLTMSRNAAAGTKTVAWTVDAVAKTPAPTVTYHVESGTVSAVIPMADFREATGAVPGDRLGNLYADSKAITPNPAATPQLQWDVATPPADYYTYTLGARCGQEYVDPPLGTPEVDCGILTDKKGDAVPGLVAPVEFENDPDLDVVGVVGRTTAHDVLVYVQVDKLAELPVEGQGHIFEVGFTAGGKAVLADASQLDAVSGEVFSSDPNVYVADVDKTANVPMRVRFDIPRSMVVFALDRLALGTLTGEELKAGTQLTGVVANTYIAMGAGWWPADVAPDAPSAEVVYAVGDNACFPPPPAKLAPLAPVRTQFGDAATVTATLLDDSGAPLAGKPVKFTVGTDSATFTSDDAGVARGRLTTAKTAGTHSMTVTFAGDSSARRVSATGAFTVVTETTKLALATTRSGTSRVVTATLRDDDGKALAGQKVDWLVNGKRVATATTDAAGRVVLRSAKATNVVAARFAGVAGKYGASSVSARV